MEGQIQELACSVCYNTFRRPSTLPCGHTFCFSCMQNATREHHNCPICRYHLTSTTAKIRPDAVITSFIESLRRLEKKSSQNNPKPQNIHVECKQQRSLLVDITTDDLLLPFNRISATFQLQSNVLIDRMERFVARQEIPFNKYAVICRLVHIEQLRRNLYKGVIQGVSFCKISSQNVQSQLSLQMDEQQFFYRSCNAKQISQSSDSNPNEYASFFTFFSKIKNGEVKHQLYQKIDPSVFTNKNDPIAVFYSILGVINMNNEAKYELAISFDEQRRIQQIKKFIKNKQQKLQKNPVSMVKVHSTFSGDKWPWVFAIFLALMLWFSKQLLAPQL